MKKHNFGAGPSALPTEVYKNVSDAVLDYNGSGLSILEISHRSKDFIAVMDDAVALVKKLFNLGEDHEVLFLQGGASLQFIMVPYNLLKINSKAAYLDSGSWASAAIKEAKKFGEIDVVASSKDSNYSFIPKGYEIPSDADYFHCTSNNTIFGTQMKEFPETNIPLVCDMSSDIFSRELDFNKFGIIYAGAQKNCGPAGVTIVVVNKKLLGKTERVIPSYLDYQIHIAKGSMFNTPSVISVFSTMLTLKYLDNLGGIKAIEKINNEKAGLLYNEIERNSLFNSVAVKEDRSNMNVCFVLKNEQHKEKFGEMCKEAGIIGINGHRSVGGYRASIYNAVSIESVKVLVSIMQELEKAQ